MELFTVYNIIEPVLYSKLILLKHNGVNHDEYNQWSVPFFRISLQEDSESGALWALLHQYCINCEQVNHVVGHDDEAWNLKRQVFHKYESFRYFDSINLFAFLKGWFISSFGCYYLFKSYVSHGQFTMPKAIKSVGDWHRYRDNICNVSNYLKHLPSSGPFAVCALELPSDEYYRMCQYDVCGGKTVKAICQVMALFASECTQNGIDVSGWRDTVAGCGKHTLA